MIAKKIKPKKRGVDAATGEPLEIGKFLKQFPKMVVPHVEKTQAWAEENPDAAGEDVETFWMRKPVPPTPPKFVDAETAQGMNIGLSRGFPPFEDVAIALETFDLDMLPVEFVIKLSAWDLDSLRLKGQEHKGDPPELIARADRAEQLCIALADTKKIRQRLTIMQFVGGFDDHIERCQQQTETVLKATLQYMSAAQFPKFIKIARDVINRINQGTNMSAVQGLPLNQLCKLVETKTSGLMGKQQTLLYVDRCCLAELSRRAASPSRLAGCRIRCHGRTRVRHFAALSASLTAPLEPRPPPSPLRTCRTTCPPPIADTSSSNSS